MHQTRTNRSALKPLSTGLLDEYASESVLTASGVEIVRIRATATNGLAVEVPAHAGYGLLMATHPSAADEAPSVRSSSDITSLSNFSRGHSLSLPPDHDILFAHLPDPAFEHVSGRWQLVAAPIEAGTRAVDDDSAARYLCLALLSRPPSGKSLEAVFVNSLSLALLTHFLKLYCPVQASRDDGPGIRLEPWQLRIAEETMLARLDQRLPISVVAERCGVSVVYFSRAFRRTTNETPHRWLMRRRLEKACVLLINTDETIADIALACGFSDQSHLTRSFSLFMGTTPACWRTTQKEGGSQLLSD